MKRFKITALLVFFLAASQFAFGAVSIFFFKTYSEDFKKNKTNQFVAGDPIYGLINVSAIAINDNNVTSIQEFADGSGGVMIRIFFPDLNKEVIWKMTLASGRVKNNRFLFCVLPESPDKLDKDYLAVLKILNSQKGNKVKMTVRAGQKDATAWWEDDITIDLTAGLGKYGDWYNQFAPASVKNTNVYYNVCETKSQTYIDFQREKITVKTFTADSLKFDANGTVYSAKKVEGYNFYEGGKDVYHFYAAKVDDNSFVIYQWKSYAYFHADQSKANEQDENKRCPGETLSKLEAELKKYDEQNEVAYKKQKGEQDKQNRMELNNYVRTAKSKRNDPVLEKKIIEWWNVRNAAYPATKIIFIEPDFNMVRDQYNQVLRKIVGAMVVYHDKSGHCFAQWSRFGYEHLGGGAFAEEVNSWVAGYQQYSNYGFNVANQSLVAGTNYELDCNAIK